MYTIDNSSNNGLEYLLNNFKNAILIKALGDKKDERHLAFLYNGRDNWYDLNGGGGPERFSPHLFRMVDSDKTVFCSQGAMYLKGENGIFSQTSITHPSVKGKPFPSE